MDICDKSIKSGKDLGCERTNRSIPRNNPNSLRPFRGEKVKKGYRSIRKTRYSIQPGTKVLVDNKIRVVTCVHNNGKSVQVVVKGAEQRDYSISKCKILSYPSVWKRIYL